MVNEYRALGLSVSRALFTEMIKSQRFQLLSSFIDTPVLAPIFLFDLQKEYANVFSELFTKALKTVISPLFTPSWVDP